MKTTKKFKSISRVGMVSLFLSVSALAQPHWSDVDRASVDTIVSQSKYASSSEGLRVVDFDLAGMKSLVNGAQAKARTGTTLTLPAPSGDVMQFVIEPSGVLPEALRKKYPSIAAFKGYAVADPSITLRFELTDKGFSAQVLQPGSRWMIDPLAGGQKGLSVVYYTKDTKRSSDSHFCEFEGDVSDPKSQADFEKKLFAVKHGNAAKSSGSQLRTYRLAVAATGEYGVFHGGQKSTILSAVTTTVNRVTGILEKEMALSLQLVPDNDKILFTSVATSPFTGNNNASVLIDESQEQIDLLIGPANYDIGHTFSTGAGGLASLGSVCNPVRKAQGVTGSSQPRGEYFDVDFVAHEIGHQLGANHTFNGANGGCAGATRNYLTAYEPGSGSTIQAYPSLCGVDDLQNAVDPFYHSESFEEIQTYITGPVGSSCGVVEETANTPPVVDAGSDYVIPKGTPIIVTGSASDAEQSELTYLWEQRDLGSQAALSAPDDGEIPLFRVLTPTSSPTRYLPALLSVLSGNYSDTEKIPQVARDMNLRLTVRDGVGGVNSDDIVVTVSGSAGPFSLLSPNGGEVVGESKTIRWDVSETDKAPINASQVEILLSTNGGVSFDTSLGLTDNDGLASVSFPGGIQSSSARIMIRAKDNIFYDISDANFTLDSDKPVPPAPTGTTLTPTDGGVSISFTPGLDNGVPVTSYEVVCSTEDVVDEYAYSTAPAVAIPDQGTIDSTISVDVDLTIQEGGVKIPVDITHTYRGDIVLALQSPAGTVVNLKSSLGSDGGDDVVGVFPDSLAPDASLDNLVGESSLGDWKLTVTDFFELDTGSLNSWGVTLSSVTPGDEVSNQGTSSPITLTGMQNDEAYSCEITAFAGSDPSETIAMGQVTPSGSLLQVTPSVTVGGSLSPSDPQSVMAGETVTFTAIPDSGYELEDVGGTCGGVLSGTSYTTDPVTENCTVVASFSAIPPVTYTVTPSALNGGNISPMTPQTIVEGDTASFIVTPLDGFEIEGVSGTCGGSLEGSTFTTEGVFNDCSVVVTFVELPPESFVVTPSSGEGGTISPNTPVSVLEGVVTTFALAPATGFQIDSVDGTCGGTLSGTTFTTNAIVQDCTVEAFFSEIPLKTYVVTPTATEGGTITPGTPQSVLEGTSTAFAVVPDSGFEIDSVGGTCGGSLSDSIFTTNGITQDCTVTASFLEIPTATYFVTPSAGEGGSISPSVESAVLAGANVTFALFPDDGFILDSVVGSCGGTLSGSTFVTEPISEPCTVEALFRAITYTVTPISSEGGSVLPATPQIVLQGETASLDLTIEEGFGIDSIGGSCGGQLIGTTYTTLPVTSDCFISVQFGEVGLGLPIWLIQIATEGPGNSTENNLDSP